MSNSGLYDRDDKNALGRVSAEAGSADRLHAGTITGAYGIKGWVKVHALTDPPDNFLAFSAWYASDARGSMSGGRIKSSNAKSTSAKGTNAKGTNADAICFEAGRRHGRGLIAKIRGVDTRTAAEQLRGMEIWVPADELAPLEDGEFYWHELVGLRVWCRLDDQDLLLGEIDHLLETGANDVLVLAPCPGSLDRRERLIPYLPGDVIQHVDLGSRRVDVRWHPDD